TQVVSATLKDTPEFTLDLANPATLLFPSNRGPYRSTNSGSTWQLLNGSVRGFLDLPAGVEVSAGEGGEPQSRTVPLEFAENDDWTGTYTASLEGGEGWLAISGDTGEIPSSLTLEFTPGELLLGDYMAT